MGSQIGPGNLRGIVASGCVHRFEPGTSIRIARAGIIHGIEPRARGEPPRRKLCAVRIGHCREVFFALFAGFLGCNGSAIRSIEASRPPTNR